MQLLTLSTRSRSALVAILMLMAYVVPASPASATPPGTNGRIAFMRHDDQDHWQIWTANPDMTNADQITDGPYDNAFPAWSPDGTKLAFASTRSDASNPGAINDIFVMNADGSGVVQLSESIGWSSEPTWSPDGNLIAFHSDAGNWPTSLGLFVVPSDGTADPVRLTTLSPNLIDQGSARFSPDGSKLLFTQATGTFVQGGAALKGINLALFTINIDGTGIRRLTPWGIHAVEGDWSPDGTRIVIGTFVEHLGHTNRLMIMNADGSNLRPLTGDHGTTGIGKFEALQVEQSYNPTWSPDGTTILFSHLELTPDREFLAGLQSIAPDGSGQHWIAQDDEHQADWGTAPLE
jgi:Tol biopolymer transport system component